MTFQSMHKQGKALLYCVASLFITMSFAHAQPGPGGRGSFGIDPRAEDRTYTFEPTGEQLPYCVFKSSRIEAGEAAPLIVSLHGLGAGPQIMCNKTAVDLAEAGGYILVAPMGYNVSGWYGSPVIQMNRPGTEPDPKALAPETLAQYSEQDVMNVLAMVREEFSIDDKRIYLTGHSMGGAGTYYLGSAHPELWAAIAPVAPAAFRMAPTRAEYLQKLADAAVPVMVVHGATDEVVPVATSHEWVATMKEIGMAHEYVELPDIMHGPVITASQASIYEFFGKHVKK